MSGSPNLATTRQCQIFNLETPVALPLVSQHCATWLISCSRCHPIWEVKIKRSIFLALENKRQRQMIEVTNFFPPQKSRPPEHNIRVFGKLGRFITNEQ